MPFDVYYYPHCCRISRQTSKYKRRKTVLFGYLPLHFRCCKIRRAARIAAESRMIACHAPTMRVDMRSQYASLDNFMTILLYRYIFLQISSFAQPFFRRAGAALARLFSDGCHMYLYNLSEGCLCIYPLLAKSALRNSSAHICRARTRRICVKGAASYELAI